MCGPSREGATGLRTLIVGSTSAVGASVAREFASLGPVLFAGRRNADILMDLEDWKSHPATSERFDTVVQLAADFGGASDEDMIRAEIVNSVGMVAVCRLAREVGARHLIVVSSISATYEAADSHFGIYSLSKRHGEEVAQLACRTHGMALTILRPSQIYDDAGQCRPHQELLYLMADRAAEGLDIAIFGSHDARRNLIHVTDFATICRLVALKQETGVFACVHPHSVCLSEMAEAAFAAFGRGGQVRFLTDRPALGDLPIVDDFRLFDLIKYSPQINVRQGYVRIKAFREAS
ncbi:MAG: NAD(P)-dependent oxidoreductase [Vicinamibacteria bacterium]